MRLAIQVEEPSRLFICNKRGRMPLLLFQLAKSFRGQPPPPGLDTSVDACVTSGARRSALIQRCFAEVSRANRRRLPEQWPRRPRP